MVYEPGILISLGFILLISLFLLDCALIFLTFLPPIQMDREDREVHSIAVWVLGLALILCLAAL
jgi:hypothetical protein